MDTNFDLQDLDKPEVIGVVITQKDEKVNLCPVNWQVTSTSYEKPPVVCIGLSRGNYSLETILETREFSYAYPGKEQLKDVLYCGTVSGRNVNKLEKTQFQFEKSTYIKPPLLKNAVLNFECKLFQTVELDTYTIVIGKVVAHHLSSRSTLDKIYALGGFKYGVIEKINVLQEGRA